MNFLRTFALMSLFSFVQLHAANKLPVTKDLRKLQHHHSSSSSSSNAGTEAAFASAFSDNDPQPEYKLPLHFLQIKSEHRSTSHILCLMILRNLESRLAAPISSGGL